MKRRPRREPGSVVHACSLDLALHLSDTHVVSCCLCFLAQETATAVENHLELD